MFCFKFDFIVRVHWPNFFQLFQKACLFPFMLINDVNQSVPRTFFLAPRDATRLGIAEQPFMLLCRFVPLLVLVKLPPLIIHVFNHEYNSPFRLVLISVASHHLSTSVAVSLHLAASLTDDSLLAASWRCKWLELNLKKTDRDVGGLDDRISLSVNEKVHSFSNEGHHINFEYDHNQNEEIQSDVQS